MKVAYLHQYFNSPDMPGSTRSYELGRRLVTKGHEVHMVTTDRGRSERKNRSWRTTRLGGMTIHWVNVPYDNAMSFAQRIQAFMKFAWLANQRAQSIAADIIYASSTPLTIALPAVRASRRLGIPLVFEVRDLWPAGPIALGVLRSPVTIYLARWLERFAYRHSARIVTLAPGMKMGVAETGYPEEQITVIPNGCDLELFGAAAERARKLRSRNKWLKDRPLITYIGSLGRVNDVRYLVHVAKHAIELDPELRFAVVGSGAEKEGIRSFANDLCVLDNNFMMLEEVPKTEAAAWFVASTMTIVLASGPSSLLSDSTANKYFDSLAAGTPVASNYQGWQVQIATEAGAGLVVDANDHRLAAQQLVNAIGNKAWLSSASAAAITLARTRFSRDSHADALETVLFDALGQ